MEAPCREESLPLHVKNPLHYSYKSRGKPRCSGPPAHPQYSTIILCKEVCTQKEEGKAVNQINKRFCTIFLHSFCKITWWCKQIKQNCFKYKYTKRYFHTKAVNQIYKHMYLYNIFVLCFYIHSGVILINIQFVKENT